MVELQQPAETLAADDGSVGVSDAINRSWEAGRKLVRMHGADDIIREAAALPVEERARVIDALLRTLNPPNPDIDREWIQVANRRLAELRSGAVRSIPVSEVFARIRDRFAK